MNDLWVWNRQRVRPVNLPLLRRIVRELVRERLRETHFEIAVYLVDASEMSRINQTFLQHAGSTDVITFSYTHLGRDHLAQGEIFVSVDDAVGQAGAFRTTWQVELVRYVVHGILHLLGYDDRKSAKRKLMKAEEDRLVRLLGRRFSLSALQRRSRSRRT